MSHERIPATDFDRSVSLRNRHRRPNFRTSPTMKCRVEVLEPRIVLSTSTSTIIAPIAPVYYDGLEIFSSSVSASEGTVAPTGTVTYFEGPTALGTAKLDSVGQATFDEVNLSAGLHIITSEYNGDRNFSPSTAPAQTAIVNLGRGNEVVASTSAIAFGQSVTITAGTNIEDHGSGNPTGTVMLLDGTTPLGSEPLDASGLNTFIVSNLAAGSHSITSSYSGDGNFQSLTSLIPSILQVSNSHSTTTLAPPTTTVFGQATTFSATVAAVAPGSGMPTGAVTFYGGSTLLGVAPLMNGTATLTTSAYTASSGEPAIIASYSGDSNFIQSSSPAFMEILPSIVGTVYLDLNASGTLDAGEPGLPSRMVFLDLKHDGSFDAGDPVATTDIQGHFSFSGINVTSAPVIEMQGQDTYDRHSVDKSGIDSNGNVLIGVVPISSVSPVMVVSTSVATGAVSTLSASSAYVQSVYRSILGRDGAASEMAGWIGLMAAGSDDRQVAEAIYRSPEHRQDQVDAYYEEFLHRPADPSSISWVNLLQSGVSEEHVVGLILNSDEFQSAHQDSSSFVSDLYLDVLGRSGTSSEITGLENALSSGMSRQAVEDYFVESPEALDQAVNSLYASYLHRQPEAAASDLWTGMLASGGGSVSDLAIDILSSAEFSQTSKREIPSY